MFYGRLEQKEHSCILYNKSLLCYSLSSRRKLEIFVFLTFFSLFKKKIRNICLPDIKVQQHGIMQTIISCGNLINFGIGVGQ